MRYVFILLATSILVPASSVAQDFKGAIHTGVVYGYETGFGFGTGGTKFSGQIGSFSHVSVHIAFGGNGIDPRGELYETVGSREFSEDIVDTGYSSTTIGGSVGIRAWKYIHVLASLERKTVHYVQKRYDDTTILGENGRYYTRYTVPDRSGWGIGGGVKFFIPVSGGFMITPTIMGSTTSKIILSVGFAGVL